METFVTNKDKLVDKIKIYGQTSINLLKLNAVEKTAEVISSLSYRIVLLLVVTMFTLFINLGVSLYLGKLLGEYYLGFFIVSITYLVIGIIVYIFRHKFFRIPISNMLIRKILEKIDLDEVVESENL